MGHTEMQGAEARPWTDLEGGGQHALQSHGAFFPVGHALPPSATTSTLSIATCWAGIRSDTEVVGQSCHLLRPDDGQFILLAEAKEPIASPGYDHLGLLVDTRGEVDATLEKCRNFQKADGRLRITEYEDLVGPRSPFTLST